MSITKRSSSSPKQSLIKFKNSTNQHLMVENSLPVSSPIKYLLQNNIKLNAGQDG